MLWFSQKSFPPVSFESKFLCHFKYGVQGFFHKCLPKEFINRSINAMRSNDRDRGEVSLPEEGDRFFSTEGLSLG